MSVLKLAGMVLCVTGAFLIAGCGDAPEAVKPTAKAEVPASVLLSSAPANPRGILAVKAEAKVGDEVVVTGKVGGRKDPFVADRAILMLMDEGLKDCSVESSPMPLCKTPWDYCCDEPAVISKHAATIQVVDAQGKAIKAELKAFGEMKPGSTLTVVGKVVENADGRLLVNASGIYVKN